jgi:hypothetical protein
MVGLQPEGMDLKTRNLILVLLILSSLHVSAFGAGRGRGEISVNIFVNYGFAYRDDTWVPVDVLVINDDADISGWVEVRTFAGDQEQSPRYRVPAECPKGSKKRFRLNCRLKRTTRIEAMLYHRNRPAVEFPAQLGVVPIEQEDLLALILDEEPSDFGFLYTAIQQQGRVRGFHREGLRNEELPALADHPQCYACFDVIVMGDIDPSRISQRHRDLLRRYVDEGGVLVAALGEHARLYRGTWVEDLLGIEIGSEETMDEKELARAAFLDEARAGVRTTRECTVVELIPRDPSVKTCGNERVVATLRPIGRGFTAAIAVDATSHALQNCVGYNRIWQDLCSRRYRRDKLNMEQVGSACAQWLPALTGVRIQPKSSVLAYLSLYFGVAIVGNWLLFNRLKRRELAWLFLIIFSAGFTAYAMVFGTAGRAKAGELEQVEVLQAPVGGGTGELNSLVGVLTARTSRYSMTLTHPFALASDVASYYMPWLQPSRRDRDLAGGTLGPFYFIEGRPPRIENLTVGASELRLVRIVTDAPVGGGIEGRLVLDDNGLNGSLVNKTGLKIRNPFIVLEGRIYPLENNPDAWQVAMSPVVLERSRNRLEQYLEQARNYRYWGGSQENLHEFRNRLVAFLFSDDQLLANPALGPFLCGWMTGRQIESVKMDVPMPEKIRETLLVAEIDVERVGTQAATWRHLEVEVNGVTPTFRGRRPSRGGFGWYERSYELQAGTSAEATIIVPRRVVESEPSEILVELTWQRHAPDNLVFAPEGAAEHWPNEHAGEPTSGEREGIPVTTVTYLLDDWQSYYDEVEGVIRGGVRNPGGQDSRRGYPEGRFTMNARVVLPHRDSYEEGWSIWQ